MLLIIKALQIHQKEDDLQSQRCFHFYFSLTQSGFSTGWCVLGSSFFFFRRYQNWLEIQCRIDPAASLIKRQKIENEKKSRSVSFFMHLRNLPTFFFLHAPLDPAQKTHSAYYPELRPLDNDTMETSDNNKEKTCSSETPKLSELDKWVLSPRMCVCVCVVLSWLIRTESSVRGVCRCLW